jgi:glyceraldehyde-3-phosphate dehydrogenase/erythrose-4-phosphate dehydrogenase
MTGEARLDGPPGIARQTVNGAVGRDVRKEVADDGSAVMSVGRTVKVLGWYDNELGFSNRTADLVRYIGGRL